LGVRGKAPSLALSSTPMKQHKETTKKIIIALMAIILAMKQHKETTKFLSLPKSGDRNHLEETT
jgi:hypothetical protein